MTIKVGINGMGRIGRMVVRSIVESQNKKLKINHINNRTNSETTCQLLKYDSIHGKFNADVKFNENHLIINKNKISFSQKSSIKDINWKNMMLIMFLSALESLIQKKNLKTTLKVELKR